MKKILYKTDQNNPAIIAYKEAVEKGKKDLHVLPRGNGWVAKSLLSNTMSKIFSTQQDAAKYAEANATAGTAIFIHGSDGRIKERKDY